MKLAYTAYDRSGRRVMESIDAADVSEGSDQLRRQGLFVIDIAPEKAKSVIAAGPLRPIPRTRSFGSRNRLKHVGGLARQMSVLVSTGTPVVEALASLERQAAPGTEWHEVLVDVRKKVEEGTSFSKALQAHPTHFDAVARSLVAAGEEGGRLDVMLDRLARLTRQQIKLRGQIMGAMVYPSVLICISLGVVTAMLTFVIPRFETMFSSLGAGLPPTTKVLLMASAWFRGNWMFLLGGLIGLAVGLTLWLKTDQGKRSLDGMLIRMPIFGGVVRTFASARLCRVLGVLLDGRVPLLEALGLAREAAGNAIFADLIGHTENAVTKGETMSGVLAESTLVPAAVCEAIKSGEKTGRLGLVLTTVADAMDEDNELAVKTLTSLLEPVILLLLGLVVGAMALSMFLPLFDLTAAAGSGGAN